MAASSGFALGFLRRLLCAHTTGGNADTSAAGAARRDAPPEHLWAPQPEGKSPCIVARLMGLDALPAEEAPHPQAFRRTRSASSAEGGRSPCGLGDAAAPRSPAAPVRASASLREKPAYLRAENDMFLLLSFSPEERDTTTGKADDGEEAAERRRGDGAAGDRKQRRPHRRKLQFGGDDDEADSSSGRRECHAQQGSSPVSVLEARDVHEESSMTTTTSSSSEDVEPGSATSAEEAHFAFEQQSSTTKLHTDFVQLDNMSPATSTVYASTCSDRDKRNRRMVNKSEVSALDVAGIWQPICRMVQEDLKKMEWLTRDGANVVAEMDSEILDHLICEAMVELVQLSSDAFPFTYTPKNFSQETFRQDNYWRLLDMN